ncbi:hypothetical protein [Anaeromyxobacter diazotrophicus]|uniref:Lipoprotein n=1 Tax=Anaeromyxobacter diazotrophicus TaxID=2590199 RepID=A0A7I9VLY8_9BACT|nr:hypothetical protein [Anaeromyxobacter diazotrophicus]GEJ57129.1 hypothetical protein AMYX_18700 [Anaeromyxobacter diazotrophicus]
MKIATALALALAAAGCSSSRSAERTSSAPQPVATAAPAPARASMMDVCPMAVPGTTVSAADTPQGEALTFVTSSGQVDDLRRRVRAMADMHNEHHAGMHGGMQGGMGEGGMMGGSGEGGMAGMGHGGMMMPPPSRASAEDTEGGARLTLVPEDPAQADQLRSAVRMHSERMQQGGCAGMMDGHAQ